VVEVHQVPNEKLLHYWRGTVSGSQIQFVASHRYQQNAHQPAVVLLDSGAVIAIHSHHRSMGIYFVSGILNPDDPGLIDWGSWIVVPGDSWGTSEYPAITSDGTNILATYSEEKVAVYDLMHTVAKICQ
jgi:hypothetical protein